MNRSLLAAVAGFGCLLVSGIPAHAHVVVGNRVFPVTMTFDDPGVGDEVTLPQFTWQRSAGPQNDYQVQWEFDKRITDTTAIIYNHGYDFLGLAGSKRHTGFENVAVTGKWQAFTFPDHEFVVSLGVIREFAGGAGTAEIGGDTFGSTSPTLYFGKGLGDLPIGLARPLAITGEFSQSIPDHRLNTAGDNNGNPYTFQGSLSLQYSLPYLQSQVKDRARRFLWPIQPAGGDRLRHADRRSRGRQSHDADRRSRPDLFRRQLSGRSRGLGPRQQGRGAKCRLPLPGACLPRRHPSEQPGQAHFQLSTRRMRIST
jgi:hypothetical protein